MQIVIKIPEENYDNICNNETASRYSVLYALDGIRKGTPLPKGHGRIADMDEAIKCIEEVEGEDAVWAIGLIEWACSKRTLIEADNAESEVEK